MRFITHNSGGIDAIAAAGFSQAQRPAAAALKAAGYPIEQHRPLLTELDPTAFAKAMNETPLFKQYSIEITPQMIHAYAKLYKPGQTSLVSHPVASLIVVALLAKLGYEMLGEGSD